MPSSQLKRLKQSLRAEGIVGPQQSKKQKRRDGSSGASADRRLRKNVALQSIREQFNPFEVQAPARDRAKFEVTNSRTVGGRVTKAANARPGVTKGFGEETRRKTLLAEMQRRNKVGGILDRRFGEDDPTMAPEDKILERFTKEKQRGFKRGALFDLDDDAAEEGQLTHMGRSLDLEGGVPVDDFDEADIDGVADEDDVDDRPQGSFKRRRPSEDEDTDEGADDADDGGDGDRGKPKSKAEVMKELVAKSKLHKYERQQAKDDDADERELLDKELPNLLALMNQGRVTAARSTATHPQPTKDATMNPERAALMDRVDKGTADKDYDLQLRQLALDKRAQPTERTKTAEETAADQATRLRELEEKRQRRMRGEVESSEDEDEPTRSPNLEAEDEADVDDATAFGLGVGINGHAHSRPLGVDDEDDFELDRDLIASDTDPDESEASEGSGEEDERGKPPEDGVEDDEDDDDITKAVMGDFDPATHATGANGASVSDRALAFTYPCPQTHAELLALTSDIAISDLPVMIQRIRALYHPKLAGDNKAKLGRFATTLVDHISYLANQSTRPPLLPLEMVIRHIHSMAKTHAQDVGGAFRLHLRAMHQERPLEPTPGDLMVLMAASSIFPTSDHFHHVVTPAMLCMARYLGQKLPKTLKDLASGAYLVTLSLQYQAVSKRYVPEAVNYVLAALCALAPVAPGDLSASFPRRDEPVSLRLEARPTGNIRNLRLWDVVDAVDDDDQLKSSLIEAFLTLVGQMAELWATKAASYEVFHEVTSVLEHLDGKACRSMFAAGTKTKISRTREACRRVLAHARTQRRPLALHHHRPLAIKTSIPNFEDGYNLDKHYDPDRERADMSKLRAEHKRERKGAMRELRKDANFIARENLRDKKERDREYEKKYKRLVAEIQGEEGRETKLYEREKRLRRGKK